MTPERRIHETVSELSFGDLAHLKIPRPSDWHLRHSLWLIAIGLSIGLFTPFAWLALLFTLRNAWAVKRILFWTLTPVLVFLGIGVSAVLQNNTDPDSVFNQVFIMFWFAGFWYFASLIYAVIIRPRVLLYRYLLEEADSPSHVPLGGTLSPAELAQGLPVPLPWSPSISQPTDSAAPEQLSEVTYIANDPWRLLDLNTISSAELHQNSSLTTQQAELIVSTREQVGGFNTMGHLIKATGIPVSDLIPLFGRATFTGYSVP